MAKYREVTRAIDVKVPGPPARAGRERNRWAEIDGRLVLRVTYPRVHSRADLPLGTLHSIRKQLRLAQGEFDAFVACPMSRTDYEAHLRKLIDSGIL